MNGVNYKIHKETDIVKSFLIPKLYPMVHRDEKPHIFTTQELERVIALGDDDINNILAIDLEGYLKLYNQSIIQEIIKYNVPIAVRNEAFCAGNDYVGKVAVGDKDFIRDIRLTLLNGFYSHLTSGKLDVFVDIVPNDSEDKLLDKINSLYK